MMSSSCRKPGTFCTRRVCVRGQPDWCDRPNYSWCALLHETEFPGMHRSYAGQQFLSRRPRLAVAALRHCRRAEPAFAQVPIRIASPRGAALGDNCESSDDIAHTAYRRVARRASPDWCDRPNYSRCALLHASEFSGRDLTENPQRQPESFSSCGGATLPARSCRAARQADTWFTVHGAAFAATQKSGVLPRPLRILTSGQPQGRGRRINLVLF